MGGDYFEGNGIISMPKLKTGVLPNHVFTQYYIEWLISQEILFCLQFNLLIKEM